MRSSSPRPSAPRRVQDVPFSINAQTEEDIQRANASTIEDISRNVAGLTVQNLGPGQSQVSVRGVSAGQIVRDQPGVKEQVGVYLDESVISLSLFTPDLDLFDLNRVETLRGPQGTLFGSGSVGGTHPLHHQPAEARHDRRPGRSQYQHRRRGRSRLSSQRRDQRPARRHRGASAPLATARTTAGSSTRSAPPAARTSMTAAASAAGFRSLLEPSPELKITPRVVYQKIRADGFNREEHYNLYDNQFTTTGGDLIWQAQAVFAAAREVQGRDAPRRPDGQRRISAVSS